MPKALKVKKVLRVKNISSGFGETPVLHKINFEVKEGELCSIIGPNGAGKSALIKTICQLITIYEGDIFLFGKKVTGIRTDLLMCKYKISYVPQDANVYPNLTILENLQMAALVTEAKEYDENLKKVFKLFPKLEERKKQRAKTLSGGESRMLAIARGLMKSPKLLILDEPCGGLTPKFTDEIFEKIKLINESGITILAIFEKALKSIDCADKVVMLKTGEIFFEGKGRIKELKKKYRKCVLRK